MDPMGNEVCGDWQTEIDVHTLIPSFDHIEHHPIKTQLKL